MAFNIQRYMTFGVIRVVTDALRATAKNEQERAFMRSFAASARRASKTRCAAERAGEHIPPFLIASITSACNLHCAGCYARSNHACGDEKSSGGCVAAGRGFFHINAHGGAEPCPFSPYSDINVRDSSLRAALQSPLFRALQTQGLLLDDHVGGCTLYMNKDKVEAILAQEQAN